MSKRVVQGRSASSLFLIELIVAVGFFSVTSAVCLQLFVQARLISVQSTDLSNATLAAMSAAEAFRGVDGAQQQTARILEAEREGDLLTLWYDSSWSRSTQQRAAYRLVLRFDGVASPPVSAEIVVSRLEDDAELYRLGVQTPGEGRDVL